MEKVNIPELHANMERDFDAHYLEHHEYYEIALKISKKSAKSIWSHGWASGANFYMTEVLDFLKK